MRTMTSNPWLYKFLLLPTFKLYQHWYRVKALWFGPSINPSNIAESGESHLQCQHSRWKEVQWTLPAVCMYCKVIFCYLRQPWRKRGREGKEKEGDSKNLWRKAGYQQLLFSLEESQSLHFFCQKKIWVTQWNLSCPIV